MSLEGMAHKRMVTRHAGAPPPRTPGLSPDTRGLRPREPPAFPLTRGGSAPANPRPFPRHAGAPPPRTPGLRPANLRPDPTRMAGGVPAGTSSATLARRYGYTRDPARGYEPRRY